MGLVLAIDPGRRQGKALERLTQEFQDHEVVIATSGDEALAVSPRGMDLLALLVSQPGTLFTKDELFDRLWTGVTVTENALTQVISELRFVLDETPADPKYIETVTRKGYRFKAKVEALDADPMPAPGAALAVPAHSADLQSAIATALMAGLRVTITAAPHQPVAVRETASLDAFRLATEGRTKLETLAPAAIQSAVLDFTRALALDPAYGPAHTGLALAHFWLYQASRARSPPSGSGESLLNSGKISFG